MMVLVVNHWLRGGWLEFLGQVRFEDNFDAHKERQLASNDAAKITEREVALRERVSPRTMTTVQARYNRE